MLLAILLGYVLQAQAPADPSRIGQKHGCTSDGRYWVHADKGKKVYCWEGSGFNEDAAPPFVKGYFEESPSPSSAPQQAQADVPFSPVGSTPKTSSSGGGGGGGGGSAAPKTATFGPTGAPGTVDAKAGSASGGKIKDAARDIGRDPVISSSQRSGRREPEPVSAELLGSIETGMDRATVLARLGDPHGKVLNTGEEGSLEIWTYVVRGGAFGSVRLDGGKVVKVVKPR